MCVRDAITPRPGRCGGRGEAGGLGDGGLGTIPEGQTRGLMYSAEDAWLKTSVKKENELLKLGKMQTQPQKNREKNTGCRTIYL